MHVRELLMVAVMMLGVKAGLCAGSPDVLYLNPRFDANGRLLGMTEAHCTKFTLLDEPKYGGTVQLASGWYVVSNAVGSVAFNDGVSVIGDVHLIVCNGQTLVSDQSAGALPGIEVATKCSLTIYAQSPDTNFMGRVTAYGGATRAGIEGALDSTITINGGYIKATGGSSAAGIGGAQSHNGKDITVNGGYVKAQGGQLAAGIGGGEQGDGRSITINGGTVSASGQGGGHGIGAGTSGGAFDVILAGGCICAGASPAPIDAKGNHVYLVKLPDNDSKQLSCDWFSGTCTIAFTNDIPYCAQDVYEMDAGFLFLYLPNGNYEISVLDESRAIKRYRIDVQDGPGTVKRIYDFVTFESADVFSLETASGGKTWDAMLICSVSSSSASSWRRM